MKTKTDRNDRTTKQITVENRNKQNRVCSSHDLKLR